MKKYFLWVVLALITLPTAFGYELYVENKTYNAWDQVVNGSKLYECLPSPNSGWCKEWGFYIPGTWKYWRNAWKEVGEIWTNSIVNNNSNTNFVSTSDVIATSFVPTKTNRTTTKKPTTPARPSISVLGKNYDSGNYTLNWTIPVGGILWDMVQLYENGKLISSKSIDPKSAAKGGSFTIQNQSSGTFKYNVVMCLRNVCSSSGNMNITVYNGNTSTTNNTVTYTNTYNIPTDIQKVITSATPLYGTPTVDSVSTSNNRENVKRVMNILSKEKWSDLFPVADSIYNYEKFLQAVAKYPKFCGEVGDNIGSDSDSVCRKELATLLSFYAYESGIQSTNLYIPGNTGNYPLWKQGLYYTQIPGLNSINGGTYFGRGSFLLSGENTYKMISEALYGDENTLLKEPSRLAQDGYTSLASGMWYYMTPKNQTPSMHDIVVGNWKPTNDEIRNGMEQGFGAVMQTFDTRICDGTGIETTDATRRIEYYKEFSNALWNSVWSNTSCRNLPEFSTVSYPVANYYWKKNSTWECSLSSTPNNFYVFKEGSYEACRNSNINTSNSTTNISNTITPIQTINQNTTKETTTYPTSKIPTFKPLPAGISFEDLSVQIEKELKADIKSWKISSSSIRTSLANFDAWIAYLSDKNETTGLTGTEKRSVIILLLMRDIYSKYK